MLFATAVTPELSNELSNSPYIGAAMRMRDSLIRRLKGAFSNATYVAEAIRPVFAAVAYPVRERMNDITSMLMGMGFAVTQLFSADGYYRIISKMRVRSKNLRDLRLKNRQAFEAG